MGLLDSHKTKGGSDATSVLIWVPLGFAWLETRHTQSVYRCPLGVSIVLHGYGVWCRRSLHKKILLRLCEH